MVFEFRHDRSGPRNFFKQSAVVGWIEVIKARSDYRNGAAAACQRPTMSGRVNSYGAPRDNADPPPDQCASELFSPPGQSPVGLARTDNADTGTSGKGTDDAQ
jgi:hypothetical protein